MGSPSNPAGEFEVLTRQPITHFITDNVGAPTNLYVRDDSFLRIRVRCISSNNAIITIRSRLLRANDGSIIESLDQSANLPLDGSETTFAVQLTEGFLLSVAIQELPAGIRRGQLFATVELCRGTQTVVIVEQVLFQDYVCSSFPASWPGSAVRQPTEGPGAVRQQTLANPAGGAEFNLTFTANRRQRLQWLSATFTTSAVVANRVPTLAWNDGLGTFFNFIPVNAIIPASTIATIYWMSGGMGPYNIAAGGVLNSLFIVPLPEMFYLSSLGFIGSKTGNIQAADAYTNINAGLEEWVEP